MSSWKNIRTQIVSSIRNFFEGHFCLHLFLTVSNTNLFTTR